MVAHTCICQLREQVQWHYRVVLLQELWHLLRMLQGIFQSPVEIKKEREPFVETTLDMTRS